jgi:hypothetical protein
VRPGLPAYGLGVGLGLRQRDLVLQHLHRLAQRMVLDHLDVVLLVLAILDEDAQRDALDAGIGILDAGKGESDDGAGARLLDRDVADVRNIFRESENGPGSPGVLWRNPQRREEYKAGKVPGIRP